MHRHYPPSTDPSFCMTGIKLISDCVVDSCTAALSGPYVGKQDRTEPMWPDDALKRLVAQADAAGLQCAVHAIGDRAISQALDACEAIGGGGSAAAHRKESDHTESSIWNCRRSETPSAWVNSVSLPRFSPFVQILSSSAAGRS